MRLQTALGAIALGLAVLMVSGCEPEKKKGWVNPLDGYEATLPKDAKDSNYILARMEFGRAAMMLGSNSRAKPRLMEAFDQLGAERDNTAAALSSEQFKYYKGETYERAMLAIYLGMLEYQAGEFNNARILFTRALAADKAALTSDKMPVAYGEDFGLAYYWIGRAYARLGDADNSAIAFRKVDTKGPPRPKAGQEAREDEKACAEAVKRRAEGEAWAWKTFHDPQKKALYMDDIVNLEDVKAKIAGPPAALPSASKDSPVLKVAGAREEFLTPGFQNEANVVCMIEVGRCPYKYLGGINGERTEFGRVPCRLQGLRVYVDGHYAGPAFEVLDLWEQAATQGRIAEKDAAQAAKAVSKELLSHVPIAGSVSGYWDVSGDVRHWTTLPGKVYVFAARLAPGPHSVRVEMYDTLGSLMPRMTNTFYGLSAPKEGEACFRVAPVFEGDNQLPEDAVKKALDAGVKPGYVLQY